ncbi:methyltransferase domain-containing protein [Aquidulcibacter sp.]|jgi:SAM-dependent methyltransferase|uniref:methyltransferase domain-containing protein n=1 Tax=Aquidulcibacter sp. TaxID=2052990 RepID=UPI003BA66C3B
MKHVSLETPEISRLGQIWTQWWAVQIGASSTNTLQFLTSAEDYEENPDLSSKSVLMKSASDIYSNAISRHRASGERLPSLIWLDGKSIVQKSVFELGCGAGFTINKLGPLVKRSLGIDCSELAIRLAKGVQTERSRFAHTSETILLRDIRGTFDSGFASLVFPFLNRENVALLLGLAYQLLKKGGQFGADFHFDDKPIPGAALAPSDPQDLNNCVRPVLFSAEEIKELCESVGFKVIEQRSIDAIKKRFVTIAKP